MENIQKKFILGTKKGMTQLFMDDGRVIPVTVVAAGPCQVVQIKTKEKDGYSAIQLGFGTKAKQTKSLVGHLRDLFKARYLVEFPVDSLSIETKFKRGLVVKVDSFQAGDLIKVIGISKGKGFQGVVRRHGFHGSPASHGHKDQLRMPGSIGAGGVQHVFKGTKMGGRMGHDQVTIANLEIVQVDKENNLLYIKGALPGARGSLVRIIGEGEILWHEVKTEDMIVEPKNLSVKEEVEKTSAEKVELDNPTNSSVDNKEIKSNETQPTTPVGEPTTTQN